MEKRMFYALLMAFVCLPACMAYAATTDSLLSASTTSASTLTPTNMILDYDYSRVDSNLKPGDSAVLSIVVKNTGSQPAEKVTVSLPGTSNIPVNKKWDIGRIDPYSSKTISTTIRVAKDAYIGLHTLQVRIEFDGYDYDAERDNDQVTVWDFPIRVYGNANFQIDVYGKSTFSEDVTDRLVLTGKTNDGARDVSAILSSTCASIVGSAKKYVGDLNKGDNFRLEYDMQPGSVGVCTFSLLLDYSDVSGNALQETLSFGIDVERYDVDFRIIDVSSGNQTPGTTAEINIELENIGGARAQDVTVNLDVSEPFTAIGSSEKYVGEIGSHVNRQVSFQVLIESTADIKAYSIPLTIDYFDSTGTKHSVDKSVGVQVSGKPEINVIIEESGTFGPGVKGDVTVTVVNKGFAEVKFLTLKMVATEDYDVLTSPEIYVGNLDSDSTDSEDYTIQIRKGVSGRIPLKFEVSFKETNNDIDHMELVELELNVLTQEEYMTLQPSANPTMLVVSAVGIIVGIILGFLALWFIYKLVNLITGVLDRKLFRRKV